MVGALHRNLHSPTLSLIIGLCVSCGPATQDEPAPATQIDHVIVAVGDLQTGMHRFEELTGVRPVFGGEHPGQGTRNALVALGTGTYLELLAPQEGVETVEDAPGLSGITELTAWGWAASTDDLDATLAQLQAAGYSVSEPAPGSRETPDGGLLQWRTGAVEEVMSLGAPFLIGWDPDSPHPSSTSPSGCQLSGLTVITPDAEELARFLGFLDLLEEVSAVQGPDPVQGPDAVQESEGRYEITLRCPAGEVAFR